MTTTYFRRAPLFDSVTDLLDWSERYGARPVVYPGPEGSIRGSVECDLPAPGCSNLNPEPKPTSHVPGAGALSSD